MNSGKFMPRSIKKKYNPWLEESEIKKFPRKFIASLMSILILLMSMPLVNLVNADTTFNGITYDDSYIVSSEDDLINRVQEINTKDSGSYAIILAADITVNNHINITKPVSVTIYGENHTLESVNSYISATGGSTLNLGDANYNKTLSIVDKPPTSGNATVPLVYISNATLNMYNGVTLSGRTSPGTAGGVQLESNAIFNMYGGEISNFRAECSAVGGVYVTENAKFEMNGGIIEECSGGYCGGVGVIKNGTFVMNGGTILNCKEDYYTTAEGTGSYGRGGGVTVLGSGKFTMNDGTIENCPTYGDYGGGGVYIMVSTADTEGFKMTGGEIKNCDANRDNKHGFGGGVLIIRGSASIKEGCKIYNNKAKMAGDDIFALGKSGGNVVSKLKLGNVPEGLILEETNHSLDGWYADGVVDGEDTERWNKDDLEHAQKYTPDPATKLTTQFALKAAYGPIGYDYYNYTINYYIDGELHEELTQTGTVDTVNVDNIISLPVKCSIDSKDYVNIVEPTAQAPGSFEVNVYCSKDLAVVTTPPTPIENLIYDESEQELVNAGSAIGGTLKYSLDGTDYSETLPAGINAGDYSVYYKVFGDENHYDSDVEQLTVRIEPAEPGDNDVLLNDGKNLIYNGESQDPPIKVWGKDFEKGIEYNAEYFDENGNELSVAPTEPGTYTMKITFQGNYKGIVEKEFIIEVDKSTWGTKVLNSGVENYISADGTTSTEISSKNADKNGIIWVKEESYGTSAWYGLNNSKGTFRNGSRFWGRWLNKNSDPEDFDKYYNQLDEEHKKGAENDKLWLFLLGVTDPDSNEYITLSDNIDLYIELGEDWDKDDISAVFISEYGDETLSVTYIDGFKYPEGNKTFAKVKLYHLSPYAIYDKLNTENPENENQTNNSKWESNQGILKLTGDSDVGLYIIFSFVLVSAAAMVFITFNRKRKIK